MKRELQITGDGSSTFFVPEMNVTYHSKYGAVQESMHVFIDTGLSQALSSNSFSLDQPIYIFEMGFGTGLNALLSLREAVNRNQEIFYQSVELFPLTANEWLQLNYATQLNDNSLQNYFLQMHTCAWEKDIVIHPLFILHKTKQTLLNFSACQLFNVIYFDAFEPGVQPELWTKEVFEKMFLLLHDKGVLVTYCSKGDVRRAMLAAGFSIEKVPGPPGKREMIRAKKV